MVAQSLRSRAVSVASVMGTMSSVNLPFLSIGDDNGSLIDSMTSGEKVRPLYSMAIKVGDLDGKTASIQSFEPLAALMALDSRVLSLASSTGKAHSIS